MIFYQNLFEKTQKDVGIMTLIYRQQVIIQSENLLGLVLGTVGICFSFLYNSGNPAYFKYVICY